MKLKITQMIVIAIGVAHESRQIRSLVSSDRDPDHEQKRESDPGIRV